MVKASHHAAVMMKHRRVQVRVSRPRMLGPPKMSAMQAMNGMVEPTYPQAKPELDTASMRSSVVTSVSMAS